MDNTIFEKFINAAKKDERMLYDSNFHGEFKDIINTIYNDVKKFDIYNLDGQFQDILIKVTSRFIPIQHTNMYNSFLTEIYQELEQLVLPVIIIIPLNNFKIKLTHQQCYKLTDDIRIFQPKNNEDDDAFSRYYKKVTHSNVNKYHILTAKDKNFFNYPIMTIRVDNIPFKVNEQSARITEAVYSLIRMIDFNIETEEGIFKTHKPLIKNLPAHTYCVYWTILKPRVYECGYSFQFKFEYLLDINSTNIITHIKMFKHILNQYVNYCFIDRNTKTVLELNKIDKWLNAVLLYNSAYELASAERYDLANITLLTILESLFLDKSNKEKQRELAKSVSEFIISNGYHFYSSDVENLIRNSYKHRNEFIHEGKNFYNARSYKCLSEKQSTILGMKPFSRGISCSLETYIELKTLIKIVGYIILSYVN